jgi:hypothetical protein
MNVKTQNECAKVFSVLPSVLKKRMHTSEILDTLKSTKLLVVGRNNLPATDKTDGLLSYRWKNPSGPPKIILSTKMGQTF